MSRPRQQSFNLSCGKGFSFFSSYSHVDPIKLEKGMNALSVFVFAALAILFLKYVTIKPTLLDSE
jgi:hypothetical protein